MGKLGPSETKLLKGTICEELGGVEWDVISNC